jgi:hypothetical protein
VSRAVALPLALAAACAGGAFVLGRRPAASEPDAAAALGGLRTVIVGSLFLRAEGLSRQGRFDEVPAIYRRILELDPSSASAIDHLADVLAYRLRVTAPTDEGRVRWWREADALVREGLERAPDSVRLLWRRADLRLTVPAVDPAVARALRAEPVDHDLVAVESLAKAALLGDAGPRLGRIHLEQLARHAPRVAAERLARGDPAADRVLALGKAVLDARAAVLDELGMSLEAGGPSAALVLGAGLGLVEGVRDALRSSPPDREAARRLLDVYDRLLGETPASAALRPLVR